jgi:hypothetical protein
LLGLILRSDLMMAPDANAAVGVGVGVGVAFTTLTFGSGLDGLTPGETAEKVDVNFSGSRNVELYESPVVRLIGPCPGPGPGPLPYGGSSSDPVIVTLADE